MTTLSHNVPPTQCYDDRGSVQQQCVFAGVRMTLVMCPLHWLTWASCTHTCSVNNLMFVTLEQCKHWLTNDVMTILVSVNVYSCAYTGMCSVVMKAH